MNEPRPFALEQEVEWMQGRVAITGYVVDFYWSGEDWKLLLIKDDGGRVEKWLKDVKLK